jgi:lysophospholipase L1-like esterase
MTQHEPSKWRGVLVTLAVGTVLTFLLFETVFRVAGLFLTRESFEEGDQITVLCEGDSFTFGIGGRSFPDQTEALMDERADGDRFTFVNAGIPGLNTALLADRVPADLDKYQPDVLIVLAGENNSWNSVRMSGTSGASFLEQVDSLLLHSRVYKFLKVATIGWSSRRFHEAARQADDVELAALHLIDSHEDIGLPSGKPPAFEHQGPLLRLRDLQEGGDYELCVAEAEALLEAHPELLAYRVSLTACLTRLGRVTEAVVLLADVPEDTPKTQELHEIFYQLGFALVRDDRWEEGVEAWIKGLEKFPTSQRMFQVVAREYTEHGQLWRALELAEEIPEVRDNVLFQYLERIGAEHEGAEVDKLISRSMKDDMVRLVEAAHARGVKVILSSYPYFSHSEVEEAAEETGATYIDFRPLFAERFERREDYISSDNCHCNTAGYGLMAEVFAAEVDRILALELGLADAG